jgi:hypothetical protein
MCRFFISYPVFFIFYIFQNVRMWIVAKQTLQARGYLYSTKNTRSCIAVHAAPCNVVSIGITTSDDLHFVSTAAVSYFP